MTMLTLYLPLAQVCSFMFCSTWRVVLKMFARLFRIEKVKALEKSVEEAVYKYDKEEKKKLTRKVASVGDF